MGGTLPPNLVAASDTAAGATPRPVSEGFPAVPAYAEPPELVVTLDALARLRYPNFEVLVIDNNTKDPALWRPVEEHCARLLRQGNPFNGASSSVTLYLWSRPNLSISQPA